LVAPAERHVNTKMPKNFFIATPFSEFGATV
jgi:hypothetical protein